MPYEIDFLESYDINSITTELRRIAELLGKESVSAHEIQRYGRLHPRTVKMKFGSLRNAHIAAGLVPVRSRKWTTAELAQVVAGVWALTLKENGRSPHMSDFRKYGIPVSAWTVTNRFGTWKKALLEASQLPDSGQTASPLGTNPPRRAPISMRARFTIFKRDLYECRICHRSGVKLEVDHIVPASQGGSDEADNLQTLCFDCNRGKGDSLQ